MLPPPNDPGARLPLSSLPSFDPRQVPVAAVDHDLPAVARERLTAEALRLRLGRQPDWQPDLERDALRVVLARRAGRPLTP